MNSNPVPLGTDQPRLYISMLGSIPNGMQKPFHVKFLPTFCAYGADLTLNLITLPMGLEYYVLIYQTLSHRH